MINIEENLNSTKETKTKGKFEKLTVVKYALGFFNNEEILHILKPAKKKYKDLFGIKAGHYQIFFYLKNLYTNKNFYSFMDEVEYNYFETREKFEDIDIDEFEDAYYFFLQYVKNIEKKSIIRIKRIDKSFLRFLKNKFNDDEFTFDLEINDYLIPNNYPEIAEEVKNYFIKESKKVTEIHCDFDVKNNSLLKLAEILINSNSEKLEKVFMRKESIMNTVNLTGNITNLKIYKCLNNFLNLPASPEKFEENLMKMPNLLQLATKLPMRSSVFNKEKVFENLVSGEFNIINIVSEDFTLFFSGMPKLENLVLTFSKINDNTINHSVFKNNILQIFYLQNLKELTINFEDDDTNSNSLLMLSEFIKEWEVEHLESLKIYFNRTNIYKPIIFKNFKDFIFKNKTVKEFDFCNEVFNNNPYIKILPVFETDLEDQIAFDLCLELLKRNNISKPCQIKGSFRSISLLFKAIVDNNSLCLFQYIDEIHFSDRGFHGLPKIEEDELAKVFSCAMKEMTNLNKLYLHFTDINCKYLCNLIEIKQPLEELTIDTYSVSFVNSKAYLKMFTKIPPVDTLRYIHIISNTLTNEFLSILTDHKFASNLIDFKLGYYNYYNGSKQCDHTVLERFFKSAPNLKTFSLPFDIGELHNHGEIRKLFEEYNIKVKKWH